MDSTRHDSISTIIERQPLQIEMWVFSCRRLIRSMLNDLLIRTGRQHLRYSSHKMLFERYRSSSLVEFDSFLHKQKVRILRRFDHSDPWYVFAGEIQQKLNLRWKREVQQREKRQTNRQESIERPIPYGIKLPKSGRRLQFSNNQSENLSKRRMKHMKSAELKRDCRKQEQKGRSKPKKFKK